VFELCEEYQKLKELNRQIHTSVAFTYLGDYLINKMIEDSIKYPQPIVEGVDELAILKEAEESLKDKFSKEMELSIKHIKEVGNNDFNDG
jgi:hypothetical protein